MARFCPEGPLDTVEGRLFVLTYKGKDNRGEDLEQVAWSAPFGEAYSEAVAEDRLGRAGPVDIYHRKHRKLLMLYLVKSGTTCEWQRLEEKWEVPIGPIALEPLLPRLGTPTRRRIVTRKINKALLEGGLPTSAPKICCRRKP